MDKSHLKEKGLHELKEFAVIVIYLWLVLGLFELYRSVILNEDNIDFVTRRLAFALINALALGKVLLGARALHLVDRFTDLSLAFTVLIKSALSAVALAAFKVLEETAIGLYHHKSFQQSIELGGGTWQGILIITLILFVVLIPFVVVMDLQTALGKDKCAQIFFGPRSSAGLPKRAA